MKRTPANCRHRQGIAILEFVLVMPVLFLALLAGVQFASLMTLNSSLQATAIEAARIASMECTAGQIDDRVNEFLNIHGMSLGPGVLLVVQDASGVIHTAGDGTLTSSHLATLPSGSTIRAVLVVSMDATPVPNLLESFCLDFSDNQFELCASRYVVDCECS